MTYLCNSLKSLKSTAKDRIFIGFNLEMHQSSSESSFRILAHKQLGTIGPICSPEFKPRPRPGIPGLGPKLSLGTVTNHLG